MQRLSLIPASILAMFVLFGGAMAPIAMASVSVVDQSYVPSLGSGTGNLSAGFGSINPSQERAQSFTVGLSGDLVRVEVYIHRFSGTSGNLVADIRPVDASGHPTNTSLANAVVAGTDIPTFPDPVVFFPLDFSGTPIAVHAGDHLAVALHGTAGDITFTWIGDTPGAYTGGAGQERVIGNHSWISEFSGTEDLGFRTFVNIPEPAAGVLALFFLVIFWCGRWQRAPGFSKE